MIGNFAVAHKIKDFFPAFSATTGGAIGFGIKTGNVSTGIKTLFYNAHPSVFSLPYATFRVSLQSSKLQIDNSAGGGGRSGGHTRWSTPISASSFYNCIINFPKNNAYPAPQSPMEIWFIGEKQTVTKVIVSGYDVFSIMDVKHWFVGGDGNALDAPTTDNLFSDGGLTHIDFYSDRLTDAEARAYTMAGKKRMGLQIARNKLIDSFQLDEIPTGKYTVYASSVVPNADIATPWGSATPHYSRANSDNGVYLTAAGTADANETEKLGFGTITLPTDREQFRVDLHYNHYGRGALTSAVLKKGDGFTASYSPPSTYDGSTAPEIHTYFELAENSWIQSEVDDLEWWGSTGTTDKNTNINFDLIRVIFASRYGRLRSMVSGNELLPYTPNANNTPPSIALPNHYLSY